MLIDHFTQHSNAKYKGTYSAINQFEHLVYVNNQIKSLQLFCADKVITFLLMRISRDW